MTSPASGTKGLGRPEAVCEPTDGDLIRACEHLLFETGNTGVESVDNAIVMVCHALLGRIFPDTVAAGDRTGEVAQAITPQEPIRP